MSINGDPAELALFPFGVAVFHVREEQEFRSITDLAVWRQTDHVAVMERVRGHLRGTLPAISEVPQASYVLSAYEVVDHSWKGPDQVRAGVALVSMPKTLLPIIDDGELTERDLAEARAEEARLIDQGFSHSEIVSFGVEGVSVGYASWSAVAYYRLSPRRALPEPALVDIELRTQALWCYSHEVIHTGKPLEDHPERCRRAIADHAARLLSPTDPMETAQACLLREAVVKTSRIGTMVEHALRRTESGDF